MKYYFILIVALMVLGCRQTPKRIVYEKDSVKLKQDFLPGVSGASPKASLEDSLYGIWTDGSDENATIKIKQTLSIIPISLNLTSTR